MVVKVLFVALTLVVVYLVADIIKLNFSNKKKEKESQLRTQYRRVA